MNCLEFRQLKLSDPYEVNSTANLHRDDCLACRSFETGITGLDAKVHQALSVSVPEGLSARILLHHSLQKNQHKPTRWLRLGVAASLLMAFIFGAYQFTGKPINAAPLLAHAAHQPHEFYGVEHEPISNEQVTSLLNHFNLNTSLDDVVYAARCPLDGEDAVHLVVRDQGDQYTVMLIPNRSPGKTYQVNDKQWRGYISQHPAGALAVLAAQEDAAAIQRLPEVQRHMNEQLFLTVAN